MNPEIRSLIEEYADCLLNTMKVSISQERIKNSYIFLFHKKIFVHCFLDKELAFTILTKLIEYVKYIKDLGPYLDLLYYYCGYNNDTDLTVIAEEFISYQNFNGFDFINQIIKNREQNMNPIINQF